MSEDEEAPDGPEDLALLDFLAFLCFFLLAFFGVASEVASLEAAGALLVAPVESVPDAPELGELMLLEPDDPEVPLVPDDPELGLPMLLAPDDPEVPLVPELPELIPLLLLLLSVDEPEAPVPLVPELPEVSLEPDEDMPLVPLLPDVPP